MIVKDNIATIVDLASVRAARTQGAAKGQKAFAKLMQGAASGAGKDIRLLQNPGQQGDKTHSKQNLDSTHGSSLEGAMEELQDEAVHHWLLRKGEGNDPHAEDVTSGETENPGASGSEMHSFRSATNPADVAFFGSLFNQLGSFFPAFEEGQHTAQSALEGGNGLQLSAAAGKNGKSKGAHVQDADGSDNPGGAEQPPRMIASLSVVADDAAIPVKSLAGELNQEGNAGAEGQAQAQSAFGHAVAADAAPSHGTAASLPPGLAGKAEMPAAPPGIQLATAIHQELTRSVTSEPAAHEAPKRLTLRLHPEDLGVVHLEMRMTGEKLQISVQAEKQSTSDLLKQDADQLASAVTVADNAIMAVDVTFMDSKSLDSDNRQNAPSQQWQPGNDGRNPAGSDQRSAGRQADERATMRPPLQEQQNDTQSKSAADGLRPGHRLGQRAGAVYI